MKKFELLPTEENLIDTLCKDTIDRNKDIVYFYKLLQAQETAGMIAIDGRWGSGKTFFACQTQMVINALNPSSEMDDETRKTVISSLSLSNLDKNTSKLAVYYDAWLNDNDTEPILSLLYEIASQLGEDFSLGNTDIVKTFAGIFEMLSGHNITSTIDASTSDDVLLKFKKQKGIKKEIDQFLSNLINERANRLFVFIDELDRCKPSFAVHLLEQVKHYIFDDRITFVFSVNLEQLQHTIKRYYGDDFDSCRYLDRFFDLRISLPPANMDKFYNNLGIRSMYYVDRVTKTVIRMLNLELREITKFYLQVKVAVYEPTHSRKFDFSFPDGKGREFIVTFIVPLLIGLKIADISKYDNFINGRNIEPLRELLLGIDEDNNVLLRMLNSNESFEDENGKTVVTPDDVIRRIYEAIFVNQYNQTFRTQIGMYEFTKESKVLAISCVSMMSQYAELL